MTRLPDLERALFDAATRLDAARATGAARAPLDRRHTRRWRRGSTPLLSGLASLLVAAGGVAAVRGPAANGHAIPDAIGSARALDPAGTTAYLAAGRPMERDARRVA
jgi:hypothetical protein